MAESNGSLKVDASTQAGLSQIEQKHDEHQADDSKNDSIDAVDTPLNTIIPLGRMEDILQQQYGEIIDKHNAKLAKQFNAGKISVGRYEERKWTMDKYLNHVGKEPKKAFSLILCYVGDEKQTEQKLHDLNFDYKTKWITGQDGLKHKHFELTNEDQRKEWKQMWAETYERIALHINEYDGLKIFKVSVHLDEGAPHAHFKAVNVGHTKSGKPSYSTTQAVSDFNVSHGGREWLAKSTEKTPVRRISGKGTFRIFRQQMDSYCVDTFNNVLAEHGYSVNYKFKRKGKVAEALNKLTQPQYKALMAFMDGELEREKTAFKSDLSDAYTVLTGKKLNPNSSAKEIASDIKKAVTQTQTTNTSLVAQNQHLQTQLKQLKADSETERQKLQQRRQEREDLEIQNAQLQNEVSELQRLKQQVKRWIRNIIHALTGSSDKEPVKQSPALGLVTKARDFTMPNGEKRVMKPDIQEASSRVTVDNEVKTEKTVFEDPIIVLQNALTMANSKNRTKAQKIINQGPDFKRQEPQKDDDERQF